ncbi:MAG: M23 family metallopeptidase [Thermomicrobiales bacterium]|nr:MAG: M23 family metallopeptidase [Thermomicrobiales bacterium]
MTSQHRSSRRSRLLLPSAVGLGLVVGIGWALLGPSAAPVESNVGNVAGSGQTTGAPPVDMGSSGSVAPIIVPDGSLAPGGSVSPIVPVEIEDEPEGAPPIETLTGYQWPLPHGRITLPFGPTPWGSRVVDGELFHDGLDLATFCGDRVVAAHDGEVIAAGRHYDFAMGWLGDLTPYTNRLDAKQLWGTLPIVVVVDDGNGYRSMYAHFGKIVVKRGDTVEAGSLLGYEGRTGRASGCHLHYGLYSPAETAEFRIVRAVSRRMKLPTAEIARVDPRLVLPNRAKPSD